MRTTRHKRGSLVGCGTLTRPVKPQWIRYKIVEIIEKSCSDFLASHQRKCECAWPTWRNGDVSHLEIGDEITIHGEYVQPLQSVNLS
jgi:hypothetical protein